MTSQDHEDIQQSIANALQAYGTKDESTSTEAWLQDYFAKQMPEMPEEQRVVVAKELVDINQYYCSKQQELEAAESRGMSREGWLSRELESAGNTLTVNEFGEYLQGIDTEIRKANEELRNCVFTSKGEINRNPNLDGYIFESGHAASFNMDAALKNNGARAEVLRPEPGQTYAKDSADIGVYDRNGELAKEYQAKAYVDAEKSNAAFDKGHYENQERLVPEGHEQQNSSAIIEHDGVQSKPASKEHVKEQQEKAQKHNQSPEKSWNDYS